MTLRGVDETFDRIISSSNRSLLTDRLNYSKEPDENDFFRSRCFNEDLSNFSFYSNFTNSVQLVSESSNTESGDLFYHSCFEFCNASDAAEADMLGVLTVNNGIYCDDSLSSDVHQCVSNAECNTEFTPFPHPFNDMVDCSEASFPLTFSSHQSGDHSLVMNPCKHSRCTGDVIPQYYDSTYSEKCTKAATEVNLQSATDCTVAAEEDLCDRFVSPVYCHSETGWSCNSSFEDSNSSTRVDENSKHGGASSEITTAATTPEKIGHNCTIGVKSSKPSEKKGVFSVNIHVPNGGEKVGKLTPEALSALDNTMDLEPKLNNIVLNDFSNLCHNVVPDNTDQLCLRKSHLYSDFSTTAIRLIDNVQKQRMKRKRPAYEIAEQDFKDFNSFLSSSSSHSASHDGKLLNNQHKPPAPCRISLYNLSTNTRVFGSTKRESYDSDDSDSSTCGLVNAKSDVHKNVKALTTTLWSPKEKASSLEQERPPKSLDILNPCCSSDPPLLYQSRYLSKVVRRTARHRRNTHRAARWMQMHNF